MVRQVLAGPDVSEAPGAQAMPGRSLGALRSYARGWHELRSGRVDSASAAFQAARRANPDFAHAALWAAQAGAWAAPKDTRAWQADAEAAASARTLLGVDSVLAVAVRAMASRDYPAACTAYRVATERDPNVFAGWFGRGECVRLDTAIIQLPNGPQFRASMWAGLGAYREAVERAPTSELLGTLFERVQQSTFAAGNLPRRGWSADSGGQAYVALPSLIADTLAFVPVRLAEFQRSSAQAIPLSYVAAVRMGRSALVDLTDRWTKRAPGSGHAWFRRALALELVGQISDGASRTSATAALDRAAASMTSQIDSARIAVARTRIALRRADFSLAARTARAALAGARPASTRARDTLLPLAALLGDMQTAEELLVLSSTDNTLPTPVADSLQRFRQRAVLGACDGLEESRQLLERQVAALFAPSERTSQLARLLLPVYRDAVPCLGPRIISEFAPAALIDDAYQALASGDRGRARQILATARGRRTGANITSVTWDYLYAESWALVQAGDTTAARKQLLDALSQLASMNAYTLAQPSHAAGLRRSLELLHDIATGDAADRAWSAQLRALSTNPPQDK